MLHKLPDIVRVSLGSLFVVFGLDGFLHFLPHPALPGPAAAFLGALGASGYLMPLVKATELVTGALLVANRYVPLALTVLAPVAVNILAFHVALAPGGLPLALLIVAALAYLGWAYRAAFVAMLAPRVDPDRPPRRIPVRAAG